MFTTLLAIAGLIATGSASTWIIGDQNNINGNPFSKPGLGDVVAAGSSYTIIWEPTTDRQGNITLLLCKGPRDNCVTQLAIVEGYKNSGKYEWAVPLTIEPTIEKAGYGIQLVVEANRQCQYTNQFGITNPLWRSVSSSSSSSSSQASSSSSSSTSTPSGTASSSTPSNTITSPTGNATPTLPSTLTTTSGSNESPTGTNSTSTSTSTSTGAPSQTSKANAAAPAAGVVRSGTWAAVAGVGLGALLL